MARSFFNIFNGNLPKSIIFFPKMDYNFSKYQFIALKMPKDFQSFSNVEKFRQICSHWLPMLLSHTISTMKTNLSRRRRWFEKNELLLQPPPTTKKLNHFLLTAFVHFPPHPTSVTRKNRQMSKKVAQNYFTRKMIDFNTFTKNCLRMWEMWAN